MTNINVTVNPVQNMYLEQLRENGVSKSFIIRKALDSWIKNEIKKEIRKSRKKYRDMLKSMMNSEEHNGQ